MRSRVPFPSIVNRVSAPCFSGFLPLVPALFSQDLMQESCWCRSMPEGLGVAVWVPALPLTTSMTCKSPQPSPSRRVSTFLRDSVKLAFNLSLFTIKSHLHTPVGLPQRAGKAMGYPVQALIPSRHVRSAIATEPTCFIPRLWRGSPLQRRTNGILWKHLL